MLEKIRSNKNDQRLLIFLLGFVVAVSITAFLNYQMDDEIYIGFYDYTDYPDNADFENGVVTVDDSSGLAAGDIIARTPVYHFDKGSYVISVDHQNENDFEAVIYEKDTEVDRFVLSKTDTNTQYRYTSDVNLYNLRIDFHYNGSGRVTLKKSVLYSDNGAFYYDTIVYALLIIAAACVIVLLMIRIDFFALPLRDRLFFSALVVFLIVSNYPFYRPFDTVSRGDAGYHMSQTEGIYRGLLDGQMPPILYSDVMHGRGMIGALYPHLLYTIPALLRTIHVSMEGAFRLFLIFINLLTCLSSFHASRIITKNRGLSLIAMILYFMLPYRLSAITLRSAYGEAFTFIFIPLLFAGMYEILIGNKRRWMILSLGLAGIIVTHLGSALQMTEVCIIIALLYLVKMIKERKLQYVLFAIGSALMIDLWFIYSFLYYYNSDLDIAGQTMGDLPYITYYFSQMMQLLPNTTPGRQYSHQVETIGVWLILAVLLAVYVQLSKKARDSRDNLSAVFLTLGGLFIFAASKTFPWDTVSKFELLYRFATLMEFNARYYLMGQSLLLFGSIMTFAGWRPSRSDLRRWALALIMSVAVLQSYLIIDSYLIKQTPFTDVRAYRYSPDINDMLDYDFFAPYGYDHDNFPADIYSPDAEITEYWHRDSHTGFKYASDTDTYADVPLAYYTGFKAVNADDKTELELIKGDKGCIRIILPANITVTSVRLDFVGYPFDTATVLISLVSFLGLIVIMANEKRCKGT